MNIKDLLTKEQYKEQLEEYNKFSKNKNISFEDFMTKTYKINKKTEKNENTKTRFKRRD